MLEVVPLVRQLLPRLLQSGRPTVACIRTTRAKYLVFDNDATRPACVVDFGAAKLDGITEITSLEAPHRVYDAILRDSLLHGEPFMVSEVGKRLARIVGVRQHLFPMHP